MQCFSPPKMHFILPSISQTRPLVSPCDSRPGRNLFCLPSPHLCAHLPKRNVCMGLKKGRSGGDGTRQEYVGLCSANGSPGQWNMKLDLGFPAP